MLDYVAIPFTFFLLQHKIISNVFSAMSLKQLSSTELYSYCDSVMLTIALNPWSSYLIKSFNWTVWFLMIYPVTHVTRRNSGPIDSDKQIDLIWFQH